MNTARKTVTAEIVSFDKSPLLDLLDGNTPDQVIEIMQAIKQKYINREVYFIESYIGNDGEKTVSLFEQRLENDKEYSTRLAKEQKSAERKKSKQHEKEEKDRAEFERLRKKFGV